LRGFTHAGGLRCRGAGRLNDLTVSPIPSLPPFEDRRQALSYADAERRDAARRAGASHLVDQRRGQAGAAATKRVTDRNRAAVDVQFFVVDAQLALAGENLRGERLVHRVHSVQIVFQAFRSSVPFLTQMLLNGGSDLAR
jgi:hypothetical protein